VAICWSSSRHIDTSSATAPVVVLPNPNGFDTIIAAGQLVSGPLSTGVAEASQEELSAFLDNNADALAMAKATLQQETVVSVDYSPDGSPDYSDFLEPISQIRNGFRLLHAEARLASLQGNQSDGARKYLEIIRFSRRLHNEGLMLHYQVAAAYEGAALSAIATTAGDLQTVDKPPLRAELEAIGPATWNHEELMLRERTLASIRRGWWRTMIVASQTALTDMTRDANEVIEARLQANYKEALEALRDPTP
jgi:hypothetical protein